MQYPALLVTDTHFTGAPRDEYRWGLWPWLASTCREEKVKSLIFLGDLTDAKDYHSALLTNRIVKEVRAIASIVRDTKIMAGNHDWLLGGQEFFRFLSFIPGVQYISRPTEDQEMKGPLAMYLPYSKNPPQEWKGMHFEEYDYLFMHQTIKGAISSNGQAMEGEELPALDAKKIYSGDIHVPQIIGAVEYVGSPYHVHFGDRFKPRCVLLEHGGRAADLHFETISRVTLQVSSLRELERQKFKAGDQVKLRVELSEAEKHEWSALRRDCVALLKEEGAEVHGVELILKKSTRRILNGEQAEIKKHSPSDAVLRFVQDEELGGDALEAALEVIES